MMFYGTKGLFVCHTTPVIKSIDKVVSLSPEELCLNFYINGTTGADNIEYLDFEEFFSDNISLQQYYKKLLTNSSCKEIETGTFDKFPDIYDVSGLDFIVKDKYVTVKEKEKFMTLYKSSNGYICCISTLSADKYFSVMNLVKLLYNSKMNIII